MLFKNKCISHCIVSNIQDSKLQDAKRKKKKLMNERRKLQEKMRLKMVIPGDGGPSVLEAKPLFALGQIKTDQVSIFKRFTD